MSHRTDAAIESIMRVIQANGDKYPWQERYTLYADLERLMATHKARALTESGTDAEIPLPVVATNLQGETQDEQDNQRCPHGRSEKEDPQRGERTADESDRRGEAAAEESPGQVAEQNTSARVADTPLVSTGDTT